MTKMMRVYDPSMITYMCSYYNAWMETYTEEDYKRNSGTFLEDENDESTDTSESSYMDNEQLDGSSIEFQNETFSEESFGSDLTTSDALSDSFHSATEEVGGEEGVFPLSPSRRDDDAKASPLYRGGMFGPTPGGRGRGGEEEEGEEEESVFMDNFSNSSGESADAGQNVLDKLETQVMNLSLSKFRM